MPEIPFRPSVFALAVDPASPTTVYAGTTLGVFKFVGAGWVPTNTGILGETVGALAVDPTGPTTIYAGTGARQVSTCRTQFEGSGGLFRTTDGGATWTAMNAGLSATFPHGVAVDPVSPPAYSVNGVRVHKSTNGGAVWTPASVGLVVPNSLNQQLGGVTALVIDPTTPSTLYAATIAPQTPTLSVTDVFKSTDAGGSWTFAHLESGLPFTLVIDPLTPAVLYAGGNGVFKSTNGAAS